MTTINRRLLIKQLMIAAGAAALLPSCVFDKKESKQSGDGATSFAPTEEEQKLIAEIADTIIPATEVPGVPGAKALNVQEFIVIMVTDCFDPENQAKFSKGIASIDALAQERFKTSFMNSTAAQRLELLTDIDAKKEGLAKEALEGFPLIKQLTIRGYTASQYFLTDVFPYKLVPGPSKGCVAVTA